MYELKTKETSADVLAFIDAVEPENRKQDALALLAIFTEVTGLPAKMWGTSLIGFGQYHYKYASGHEGDMFLVGFSPRKPHLVLYNLHHQYFPELAAELGILKKEKGCLYVKKLSDLNLEAIRLLVPKAIEKSLSLFPQ